MKWVVLKGSKQLQRKLDELKLSAQRRVMRPAIRAGCSVVNKAAKQAAPSESGALKRAMGVKVVTRKRVGDVIGMVGVRVGEKYWREHGGEIRKPEKYAHLVEYGHGGPAPAPAHPFLRAAFDANKGTALRVIADKAAVGLQKEAERKGRG